jgi:hypothetical protein
LGGTAFLQSPSWQPLQPVYSANGLKNAWRKQKVVESAGGSESRQIVE